MHHVLMGSVLRGSIDPRGVEIPRAAYELLKEKGIEVNAYSRYSGGLLLVSKNPHLTTKLVERALNIEPDEQTRQLIQQVRLAAQRMSTTTWNDWHNINQQITTLRVQTLQAHMGEQYQDLLMTLKNPQGCAAQQTLSLLGSYLEMEQ